MYYKCAVCLVVFLAVLPVVGAQEEANLEAIKAYSLEQTSAMQESTAQLAALADRYYAVLEQNGFDYETAWENQGAELAGIVLVARETWIIASSSYELNEGIVAGVPSLAYYDVWIDAGPTGEDGGEDALDWQLELPDGRVLDKPGNFFHNLTEPTLWGTNEAFVGLAVDLDGDGEVEPTEVLPEANIFTASLNGLHEATLELQAAVEAWQPTVEDVFVALTTMIPTMSEYFGDWKESVYVSGEEASIDNFVAVSRLVDIAGILNGLNIAYQNVAPLVEAQDAELHQQIVAGFEDLMTYVNDLHADEENGVVFSAEEADLLGTEAQSKAESLAALVALAAAEVGIELGA
ncbi:MAG: EfeM/EfeO family lipoprotein [Anaerolineae bacterium]|nr:EfeM/EfeO family lipoprotein [Anaerolineae bacterium]